MGSHVRLPAVMLKLVARSFLPMRLATYFWCARFEREVEYVRSLDVVARDMEVQWSREGLGEENYDGVIL